MSYDYQALVQEIWQALRSWHSSITASSSTPSQPSSRGVEENRREPRPQQQQQRDAYLNQALQGLAKLSQACPMTPAWWIHYAATVQRSQEEEDLAATGTLAAQILQLGLQEFPGSLLLHMYHFFVQVFPLLASWRQRQQQQERSRSETNRASVEEDPNSVIHEDQALPLQNEEDDEEQQDQLQILMTMYQLVRNLWRQFGQQPTSFLGALSEGRYYDDEDTHRHDDDDDDDDDETIMRYLFFWNLQLLSFIHEKKGLSDEEFIESCVQLWVDRARLPWSGNDTLSQEWDEWVQQTFASSSSRRLQGSTTVPSTPSWVTSSQQRLEQARKWQSRHFRSILPPFYQQVYLARQQEGGLNSTPNPLAHIPPPPSPPSLGDAMPSKNSLLTLMNHGWWPLDKTWWHDHVESNPGQVDTPPTWGMGLGGHATAQAFIQGAWTLWKQQQPPPPPDRLYAPEEKEDEDELGEPRSARREPDSDEPDWAYLALSVYERGVAECPTVEALWLSYIRHLLMYIRLVEQKGPFPLVVTLSRPLLEGWERLRAVALRAVRNCPYSATLVEQRLHVTFYLAQQGFALMDPEETLFKMIVQPALDAGFLPRPTSHYALYRTALCVVQRYILFLLSQLSCMRRPEKGRRQRPRALQYDDAEEIKANRASESRMDMDDEDDADESKVQEALDLTEDLVDMYEEVENRLRKDHPKWSEGRALLWRQRSIVQEVLIQPIGVFAEQGGASLPTRDSVGPCLEKSLRAHNPPHPDVYLAYIHHIRQQRAQVPVSNPGQVLSTVRNIRFWYQKALQNVGRPKSTDALGPVVYQRDFATALSDLCTEWLEFETLFGSPESEVRANKMIKKKMQKLNLSPATLSPARNIPLTRTMATAIEEASTGEQMTAESIEPLLEDGGAVADEQTIEAEHASRPSKRPRSEADEGEVQQRPGKTAVHKVKVGKMEYPAHPFTVRVSNLNPETEDMDLVDTFREKCGAIVHARIVREKHATGKGVSKGWGLVQFEERESVEKALHLDDVLGIHENVVRIERSHMRAVELVPPGMHRVKPQGQGKYSKRNEMRKQHGKHDEPASSEGHPLELGSSIVQRQAHGPQDNSSDKEKPSNAFAFRPRVMVRSNQRKTKLQLKR